MYGTGLRLHLGTGFGAWVGRGKTKGKETEPNTAAAKKAGKTTFAIYSQVPESHNPLPPGGANAATFVELDQTTASRPCALDAAGTSLACDGADLPRRVHGQRARQRPDEPRRVRDRICRAQGEPGVLRGRGDRELRGRAGRVLRRLHVLRQNSPNFTVYQQRSVSRQYQNTRPSLSPPTGMPRDTAALVLELVLASVDDFTALELIAALRHTPEILRALSDAVAAARKRFTCMAVPRLRRARGMHIKWDSNCPGHDLYRIGPMALECMLMPSADDDVYIQSAYALSDCLVYVDEREMEFENRYKFMLDAIRAKGVHRALVRRIADTELDGGSDLYLSQARLLRQVISQGYTSTARWGYQEMRMDMGNVCLEGTLLRLLQHERCDAELRNQCVDCICDLMAMGSA